MDKGLPGQAYARGRARPGPGFERARHDQGAGKLRRLLGFYAGVLGGNPKKAWTLIEKTLPLPFRGSMDRHTGACLFRPAKLEGPDARACLRVPERQFMAQKYIDGDLPALNRVSLSRRRGTAG